MRSCPFRPPALLRKSRWVSRFLTEDQSANILPGSPHRLAPRIETVVTFQVTIILLDTNPEERQACFRGGSRLQEKKPAVQEVTLRALAEAVVTRPCGPCHRPAWDCHTGREGRPRAGANRSPPRPRQPSIPAKTCQVIVAQRVAVRRPSALQGSSAGHGEGRYRRVRAHLAKTRGG